MARAARLGQAGRPAEAEADARLAAAANLPGAQAVLGLVLQDLDRPEEALAAMNRAVADNPADARGHANLARLAWSLNGDALASVAAMDEVLSLRSDLEEVAAERTVFLSKTGHAQAGYDALAPMLSGQSPLIHLVAAEAALHFDSALALSHAERACRLAPGIDRLHRTLGECLLAVGEAGRADALYAALRVAAPLDQGLLALQAIAWRLSGDERYAELYDYEAMTGVYELEPPAGWSRLDDYLTDLATDLNALQPARRASPDMAVRGGSQTSGHLAYRGEPAIQGLFQAFLAPIAAYRARLGQGRDPLRARNRGPDIDYPAAWSQRVQPGGGLYNHIHPAGWLSAAFYAAVPAWDAASREGWLSFGAPQLRTATPLPAERFVEPQPGRLVLFPSYMWHGTLPFGGHEPRLTVAFDATPR